MTANDQPYMPIAGPYVAVTCDDRGRHRPRSVARFGQRAGEWVAAYENGHQLGHSSRNGLPMNIYKRGLPVKVHWGGAARTRHGWRLECPVCRREERPKAENLTHILNRLADSQVDTITLVALASLIR
jgi:hypothetical protein